MQMLPTFIVPNAKKVTTGRSIKERKEKKQKIFKNRRRINPP
jgi:hypothetical protein